MQPLAGGVLGRGHRRFIGLELGLGWRGSGRRSNLGSCFRNRGYIAYLGCRGELGGCQRLRRICKQRN